MAVQHEPERDVIKERRQRDVGFEQQAGGGASADFPQIFQAEAEEFIQAVI